MLAVFFMALVAPVSNHINVDARYYTLGELAASLRLQGVSVQASNEAAQDVYAVCLNNLPEEQLKSVLEADGRLTLSKRADAYTIERSPASVHRERVQLDRLKSRFASSANSVYGKATQDIQRLYRLSERDQESGIALLRGQAGQNELARASANLVKLCLTDHERPFATIALPAAIVADPPSEWFGRTRQGTLFDWRSAFVPGGDLRGVPTPATGPLPTDDDERLAQLAGAVHIRSKMMLDPLSLNSAYRFVTFSPAAPEVITEFGPHPVIPGEVPFEIKASDLMTSDEIQALDGRAANSVAVVAANPRADATIELSRPSRASEVLLRIAAKTRMNLVCYVSPCWDPVLAAGAHVRISNVMDTFNIPQTSQAWRDETSAEYLGSGSAPSRTPVLPLVSRVTASLVGGCFVLRHEDGFLDGICASPNGFSSTFANRDLKERPSVLEVAREVARLDVRRWRSSTFSPNFLTHCNPLSFTPFAACLAVSKKLQSKVTELAKSERTQVSIGEIEPGARRAFLAAIDSSASLNDACSPGVRDPLIADIAIAGASATDSKIVISRGDGESADTYFFLVTKDKSTLWSSWLGGVSSGGNR